MAEARIPRKVSKSKGITYEQVAASLRYDPETGVFYRQRSFRRWKKDDVATGTVNSAGYQVHNICGMPIPAQRLAVMLMLGRWPLEIVDHINRDRLDNRWVNLRECSIHGNNSNRVFPDRHLPLGVHKSHGTSGRYMAMISITGRNVYLGTFDTPEEAGQAYLVARNRIRGPFIPL